MRLLLLLFLLLPLQQYAQGDSAWYERVSTNTPTDSGPASWLYRPFHKTPKRIIGLLSAETVITASTLIGLNQVWYKDYPREKFHYFNDGKEWLQMDKVGHGVTAFLISQYQYDLLYWSSIDQRKAILFAGLTAFLYQGTLEMFDGYSSGWGFSKGDLLANSIGSGLFIAQGMALHGEQFMVLKYSFSKSGFAPYRPDLLGKNYGQQLLKDYNGQTYWLSFNVGKYFTKGYLPPWLNIAVGYGANGMTGGDANPPYYNIAGNLVEFDRYRQLYLSPDIDLTKIKVKSPLLKTVLKATNCIKFPAPGLMVANRKLKAQWIAR